MSIKKLDLLDKKIINTLNKDVRAPVSKIAKQVGSSKEVVSYRIKRLQDEKIIKQFVTIFGLGYWANKILVQLEKITEEKEIIEYLLKQKNVNWITSCSGNWDLIFVIMAKDPVHFEIIQRKIFSDIGQYIKDYNYATSIGSRTFGPTYILRKTREAKEAKRNKPYEIELDDKDKKILRILQNNARMKLMDISKKTKIPVDTVKYRIKKMEHKDIIKRYRLILDSSKLGYDRYEVFIRCKNLDNKTITKFMEYTNMNPNIEFSGRSVGNWDWEFTVNLKNNMELRNLVLAIKKEFSDNIKTLKTANLFETYNHTYFPEELA
jgi:Lrp/AsnC family transcriptional regulator, leucine-responsive regulatory protein